MSSKILTILNMLGNTPLKATAHGVVPRIWAFFWLLCNKSHTLKCEEWRQIRTAGYVVDSTLHSFSFEVEFREKANPDLLLICNRKFAERLTRQAGKRQIGQDWTITWNFTMAFLSRKRQLFVRYLDKRLQNENEISRPSKNNPFLLNSRC